MELLLNSYILTVIAERAVCNKFSRPEAWHSRFVECAKFQGTRWDAMQASHNVYASSLESH